MTFVWHVGRQTYPMTTMKPDTTHARSVRASKATHLRVHASTRHKVAEALRREHSALDSFTVWEVLTAIQSVGPVKARAWCEQTKVFPLARLQELTEHKRSALAACVAKEPS